MATRLPEHAISGAGPEQVSRLNKRTPYVYSLFWPTVDAGPPAIPIHRHRAQIGPTNPNNRSMDHGAHSFRVTQRLRMDRTRLAEGTPPRTRAAGLSDPVRCEIRSDSVRLYALDCLPPPAPH